MHRQRVAVDLAIITTQILIFDNSYNNNMNSIWENSQSLSHIDKIRIKTIDSTCNWVECINLVSDGNNSDKSNNHDIVISDDTKRNTI